MKYLQTPQLLQTTQLLKNIEESAEKLSFTLEMYKAVFNKKEKKLFINNFTNFEGILLRKSLESTFQDYDFEFLKSSDFVNSSLKNTKEEINFRLGSVLNNIVGFDKQKESFFTDSLFKVFNNLINVERCKIFSVDLKFGPFGRADWFFCFLFYNKKMKRILIFSAKVENVNKCK